MVSQATGSSLGIGSVNLPNLNLIDPSQIMTKINANLPKLLESLDGLTFNIEGEAVSGINLPKNLGSLGLNPIQISATIAGLQKKIREGSTPDSRTNQINVSLPEIMALANNPSSMVRLLATDPSSNPKATIASKSVAKDPSPPPLYPGQVNPHNNPNNLQQANRNEKPSSQAVGSVVTSKDVNYQVAVAMLESIGINV